jgi:hypothetical protein
VTDNTEVGGYHHSGRYEPPALRGCSRGFGHVDYRENSLSRRTVKNAGLAAVTGEHYEGGHWLGSFAVYLVTRRGIALK